LKGSAPKVVPVPSVCGLAPKTIAAENQVNSHRQFLDLVIKNKYVNFIYNFLTNYPCKYTQTTYTIWPDTENPMKASTNGGVTQDRSGNNLKAAFHVIFRMRLYSVNACNWLLTERL
jgi:hypothetical protein